MVKLATTLDRPPSLFFKKWIDYHTSLFNVNSFVFFNHGDDDEQLVNYLTSVGMDTVTFTVTVYTEGNVKEFIQQGIDSNKSFIIHCPLKYLINNKYNVYHLSIHESNNVINYIKSVIIANNYKLIYLDLDELIVSNDVNSVLEETFDHIVPMGFTVIQDSNEPRLDWNIPIHKQRSYWRREPFFYDKPIVIAKDLNWGLGRHLHHHTDMFAEGENILKIESRPDIILLHLRDVCFDYLFEENQLSLELYPYSDQRHRYTWQEKEPFTQWINEERRVDLEHIPDNIMLLLQKHNI
jgi:hypothetical protein